MLISLHRQRVFFIFCQFSVFSSSPTQPFQRHILAMTHQFSVYLRFRNSWDVINRPQSARDKENGNTVKGWLKNSDVDWDFRRLREWKHWLWNALLSAAEEAGLGQQWGLARQNQVAFLLMVRAQSDIQPCLQELTASWPEGKAPCPSLLQS